MVRIDLGIVDIEFGLHLVEGAPGLTLILFIAFSLLCIIGTRFSYYAHRNRVATDIASQKSIWEYIQYAGGFATAYGAVGILDILVSLDLTIKNVLLLATVLASAVTIRQIHAVGSTGNDGGLGPGEQVLQLAFVALLVVYAFVVVAAPLRVTAGLEGTAALVYLLYGVIFFEAQATNTRLHGTLLDSLLRHLLPLLMFSALVSILTLATALGIEPVVVWHVQVVFIIMTGTALMTGTIKLRQNLAGLSE
jgi:hypothetical protein